MTSLTSPTPTSLTEPVPLRRNTRFQLLWVGSFASALGSRMSALAYPLLVLALTGSPGKAGLVSAAQLLAMVVVALPAGILVDGTDRRRIMITCEAVQATAMATIAAAVLAGRITFVHIVVVAMVQGAAAALFNPARLIAVRAVVPPSQLRPALAQEQARTHAAALAGPVLGGMLFGVGRAVPFVVDAVSYLVSLVCVVAARVPRRPDTVASGGTAGPTGLSVALRWLRGQPFVRAVCGFSLAMNLVAGGLMLTFVVLVRERGGSAAVIGIAMAVAGVGGLVGAALSSRVGGLLPPGRMVAAVCWWHAVLLPAMALPIGLFWPAAVLAMIMLVIPVIEVTMQTSLLTMVPDELQGRISSLLMVASLGMAPLGPLLAGVLMEAIGPGRTLVVQGAFLAVVAMTATLSPTLRDHRDDPAAVTPRSVEVAAGLLLGDEALDGGEGVGVQAGRDEALP